MPDAPLPPARPGTPPEPAHVNLGLWQFLSALALGVAIVVGTIITTRMVYYVKTFNTSMMTVTGQAVQDLTSNEVKWVGQYSVNTFQAQLDQGYTQMAKDRTAVLSFLRTHGVPAADVTLSPVNVNQNYVNCQMDPKGCGPFGPTSSTLNQTVTVQSGNVQAITALAQNVEPLVHQGVIFTTQAMKYYYTNLSSLRARLESMATHNAQVRAEQIAGATGARVGRLVSVTTEPLQLTPVNSTEVSNSGVYDTTTIHKKLTAIVVASFRLS